MLKIATTLKELNFSELMEVYAEGNEKTASAAYPNESRYQGIRRAEQDFYQYLNECFFLSEGSFYALWLENSQYMSALRMEPYRDGLLLEALETRPGQRKKGFAGALMRGVLDHTRGTAVYSHVSRRNAASLAVHRSCGFSQILDYAVYADGSVLTNSVTMKYTVPASL